MLIRAGNVQIYFHRMTIHQFYFHANRGQESSMKKWWFNSMLSKKELEHGCGLSKSMDSLGPIENTSTKEDPSLNDPEKQIHSSRNSESSSYSNVNHLVRGIDIQNFISDDTFLLIDTKGDSYSIYFDIENQIFEIDNDHSFLSELESSFYSFRNSNYSNNRSKRDDPDYDRYMHDTQSSWNNHINNCVDSYLHSQICIDSHVLSSSENYRDSYISNYICGESGNSSESDSSNRKTSPNGSHLTRSRS